MAWFDLVAVLLVLTAALSYLNCQFLRLPTSIGLMALTLLLSVAVLIVELFVPGLTAHARALVHQFDFSRALLHGMLGFLLFAGALSVDLGELAERWKPIALLATAGVLLSTGIVGALTWCLLNALGLEMRFVYCLLFGALISPTDPVAVLALLKQIGAPKSLEITIAGESLFNDGVGVVVFLGLLEVIAGGQEVGMVDVVILFVREAIGGVVLGLAAGYLVYLLLKSVDNYEVEILLSLALVAGGYALAEALHLSGPMAMVVAGLLIGNPGRRFAMSPTTVEHLNLFWKLIDEILNAVLFVLLGLEMLVLHFTGRSLLAGLLGVGIVLIARWSSVSLPIWALRRREPFDRGVIRILTWGGLRGGISVAMALSLPGRIDGVEIPERDVILVITYVVVVFSLLVQGLTIGLLTRCWLVPASVASGGVD